MNDNTQDIATLSEILAICIRLMNDNTQDAANLSLQQALDELQQLIDEGLPALTHQSAPPGLLDTWNALHAEVQRLRETFAGSALAGKTVVALGGSFSAGKSSLVNALLDTRLMPTDVNPTTAVPAYAMHGEASRIQALDTDGTLHDIPEAQLKNFTHEGGGAQGIRTFYAHHPDFPWQNLALLDTPGYTSPGSADAEMARTWLNTAHAILWCIPADAGTISASDLQFLATLDKNIPFAIALTKADKKPAEDLDSIAAQIQENVEKHGLATQNIFLINAREKDTLTELTAWLANLDNQTNDLTLALKSIHQSWQSLLARRTKATAS